MLLSAMSLNDFSLELASSSPAPGGGSASAVAGALAASLSSMVANLTIGKKGYEDYQDEMKALLIQAEDLRNELMLLMDQDSESFHQLLKAMKLPKNTDEEKIARTEAIQSLRKFPCKLHKRAFASLLCLVVFYFTAIKMPLRMLWSVRCLREQPYWEHF